MIDGDSPQLHQELLCTGVKNWRMKVHYLNRDIHEAPLCGAEDQQHFSVCCVQPSIFLVRDAQTFQFSIASIQVLLPEQAHLYALRASQQAGFTGKHSGTHSCQNIRVSNVFLNADYPNCNVFLFILFYKREMKVQYFHCEFRRRGVATHNFGHLAFTFYALNLFRRTICNFVFSSNRTTLDMY